MPPRHWPEFRPHARHGGVGCQRRRPSARSLGFQLRGLPGRAACSPFKNARARTIRAYAKRSGRRRRTLWPCSKTTKMPMVGHPCPRCCVPYMGVCRASQPDRYSGADRARLPQDAARLPACRRSCRTLQRFAPARLLTRGSSALGSDSPLIRCGSVRHDTTTLDPWPSGADVHVCGVELVRELGDDAQVFAHLAQGDLLDADFEAAARRWQSASPDRGGVIGPRCQCALGLRNSNRWRLRSSRRGAAACSPPPSRPTSTVICPTWQPRWRVALRTGP